MSSNPVDVSVTSEGLQRLVRALREESDGRALRRDLSKKLKGAMEPSAQRARNAALSIPSHGSSVSPALRPAIAKAIVPQAKLTARRTGAYVKAKRTPRIRGFDNAPKRTQSAKGWRTQSWGNDVWRVQHGKTGWFDESFRGLDGPARNAVFLVMEEMAERIAQRSR